MRRLPLLALALLAACDNFVPGAYCSVELPCDRGACVDGVCVLEPSSVPGLDASLELDAALPGLDAGLDAGAPGIDASQPGLDASQPGQDASEPGPDAAEPRPDAGEPGSDAGEPGPDAGEPGPDAGEPVPSLTLVKPLEQAIVVGEGEIKALLSPIPDAPVPLVNLFATHLATGLVETYPLTYVNAGYYNARVLFDHTGAYRLVVKSDTLGSKPVDITVKGCLTECFSSQECLKGECVPVFTEVQMVAPEPAVVPTLAFPAAAELVRTPGTVTEGPLTIELKVTDLPSPLVMMRTEGDRYEALVSVPSEGTFVLEPVAQFGGTTLPGKSLTVTVKLLEILFSYPPSAQRGNEPVFGNEYFRRDETVEVKLVSQNADLGAYSGAFFMMTSPDGTSSPETPLSVVGTPCLDAPFCRKLVVDLWRVGMLTAVRGRLQLKVRITTFVQDYLIEKDLNVTRWKWHVGSEPVVSPVVDKEGRIYFATTTTQPDASQLHIVSHDGVAVGPVDLGSFRAKRLQLAETYEMGPYGTPPYVVVTGTNGAGDQGFIAVRKTSTVEVDCQSPFGKVVASAVLDGNPPRLVAVAGLPDSGAAHALNVKLDTVTCFRATLESIAVTTPVPVYRGGELFFGSFGEVRSVAMGAELPAPSGARTIGSGTVNVLAASASGLGGPLWSTGATLFHFPDTEWFHDGEKPPNSFPFDQAVSHLLFVSGDSAVFSAGRQLYSVDALAWKPPAGSLALVGTTSTRYSPIAGAVQPEHGPALYVPVELDGKDGVEAAGVGVVDLTVNRESWVYVLEGASLNDQLSLDCSRASDASKRAKIPGVLYVPTTNGLLALIVDSPGIDATAPWPMQGHDPRNTAALETDLGPYSAP